ncbi:MAG: hypothetical protein JWO53_8 [Chlamydiia bacterium]|nr:hypothetical protein [Chlamydiia bacterium]
MNEPQSEESILNTEKSGQKGKTLFSELSRLFRAIGQVVTEQAKSVPLKGVHAVSVRRKTKDLLQDAQKAADGLQLFKDKLTAEFGTAASAFISKSIDPMIKSALRMIDELSDEHADPSSMYAKAIQSAQLYSQFSDEGKLRRKIISESINATRKAIEKDCQILRNYQHHAFQELSSPESSVVSTLEKKLAPIFNEFTSLATTSTQTNDLREFFLWQSEIDERRTTLTELGLLFIDVVIAKVETVSQDVHETEEEQSPIDRELTALLILEERAFKLFQILDHTKIITSETLTEVSVLLSDLTVEVRSYENRKDLQETIKNILQHIAKVEFLLSAHSKNI